MSAGMGEEMAKSVTKKMANSKRPEDPGRRDFIVISTNAMFGLGAAAVAIARPDVAAAPGGVRVANVVPHVAEVARRMRVRAAAASSPPRPLRAGR